MIWKEIETNRNMVLMHVKTLNINLEIKGCRCLVSKVFLTVWKVRRLVLLVRMVVQDECQDGFVGGKAMIFVFLGLWRWLLGYQSKPYIGRLDNYGVIYKSSPIPISMKPFRKDSKNKSVRGWPLGPKQIISY